MCAVSCLLPCCTCRNLTGLFSLQNVTPIHVAPAVWLGLHWKGLRGEAVVAGMVTGLATTIGLVFSPVNVKLAAGLDQTACGLSTAMIGFFVNVFTTVVLGLIMQHRPGLFGRVFSGVAHMAPAYNYINIGSVRCTLLNPYVWPVMVAVLLFSVPFYRTPGSPDRFIGDMSAWAFVALLCSGILAAIVAYMYTFKWNDWAEEGLPGARDGKSADAGVTSNDHAVETASKDIAVA